MAVTRYQMLLAAVLVLWPLVITGLLFLMSRIEDYVARVDAASPQQAGLEPAEGAPEREVRISYGDRPITSHD